MRIALDAAAGDFGAAPNIEGAIVAANSFGVEVVLVGPEQALKKELTARGVSADDKRFEVVDAPEVVGMGEDPAAACRSKPRCSIMTACDLAASGKVAGVVSCGNSGATKAAALLQLKRVDGVLRPAIAAPLPSVKGTIALIDAGANADSKPWHLVQFAAMGRIYALHVLKRENPKIGILSIGEEESKGNDLVKETIPMLKASGLPYYGPVEGRDIPAGTTDVVVCDGFVGNAAMKLMEGTAETIFAMLKEEILAKKHYKLGALLLRGPFARLMAKMSYDEYGGAPLLGVSGNVIICHGNSNAKAVANALRVARELAESGVNDLIRKSVDELKQNLETTRVNI